MPASNQDLRLATLVLDHLFTNCIKGSAQPFFAFNAALNYAKDANQ